MSFSFWAKHRLFSISFSVIQKGFFSTKVALPSFSHFDTFCFLMPSSSLHTSLALSIRLPVFWVTQISPDSACLKLIVIDVNLVDCFEKNPEILSCIVQLVSPNRKTERDQPWDYPQRKGIRLPKNRKRSKPLGFDSIRHSDDWGL